MQTKTILARGHLIDSGIMSQILNLIIDEGSDYKILNFTVGKAQDQMSDLELQLFSDTDEKLGRLMEKLVILGVWEKGAVESRFRKAGKDGCVPEDFYSTSNHRTEIFLEGRWQPVARQRMDAMIVLRPHGPECIKLRDVKKGDPILCGTESVRSIPPTRNGNPKGSDS
jgi:hypothetical protein